jgi:hypothetical protein
MRERRLFTRDFISDFIWDFMYEDLEMFQRQPFKRAGHYVLGRWACHAKGMCPE